MLTPPVCFTCGYPLGDVAPIYRLVREKRQAARRGPHLDSVSPTMLAQDFQQTENQMGDVLAALNLSQCCRTRMITCQDFRKYY